MKKILFTLCLAAALTGARGQIYIDSYRFGVSECGGLLLDSDCVPDAEFAVSLRKLRTAYTGNCIEVRNASTGRTFTVGFNGNFLDTVRLKDSCATANCFVSTWYDQSGLGRNATQTGNSDAQPQITNNGALYYENGIMVLRFGLNSTTSIVMTSGAAADWKFMHDGTNYTAINVAKPTTVQGEATFYILHSTKDGNNYGTSTGASFAYDNRPAISRGNIFYNDIRNGTASVVQNPADTGTVSATNMHFAISFLDPDNATASQRSKVYVDNNAVFTKNTGTATPSASDPSQTLHIGRYANADGGRFRGFVAEIIIHDIDYVNKITSIKNNLNTFYEIY